MQITFKALLNHNESQFSYVIQCFQMKGTCKHVRQKIPSLAPSLAERVFTYLLQRSGDSDGGSGGGRPRRRRRQCCFRLILSLRLGQNLLRNQHQLARFGPNKHHSYSTETMHLIKTFTK